VNRLKIVILLYVVILSLALSACGNKREKEEDVSMSIPIHMEIPTDQLQPKMGLSGFIFGTFLMLNAYILIILSCILLAIKDNTIDKVVTSLRMVVQMLNPGGAEGKAMQLLGMLANADTRVQFGTIGLIAGVVLAYFGAWIAM
jgi:hypothetical protein